MRVLLLCDNLLSSFDCAVIDSLRSSPDIDLLGAVVNTRSKGSFLKRARREWQKGRGGFIVVQAARTIARKFSKQKSVNAFNFLGSLAVINTESLYRDEVYEWIRAQMPDCLLLRGFGIIKEPILSIAPFGVLSYHHGDLTRYRGGPPAFWELYNNESQIGITLQVLEKGVDTGTIVLQRFFPIAKNDTWSSLRKRIYDGSAHLAAEALLQLRSRGPIRDPVGPVGKLFTLPSFSQWINLQFKIAYRRIR